MSCGCSGDSNSGDVYNGYCNSDTPYPSVSHESVPSLIDNLVNALYGTITKDVSSGKVVWNIPCDPNNTTVIANIPRNAGEGLLCYIIRVLNSIAGGGSSINPAVSAYNLAGGAAWSIPYQTGIGATSFLPIGTTNQVLSINSSGQIIWGNADSANTASSVVRRDASGNFNAGTITATLTGNVNGNATTSTTAATATTAATCTGNSLTATSAAYATAAGNATTATTATNAITASTANAVVAGGVLTAMIGDSQVIGAKLETISGLSAGTYGSSSQTPVVTVDTKGRVTAISAVSQPSKTVVSFFADASYGDVGYSSFDYSGVLVDSNNMVRTIGYNRRGRLATGSDLANSTGIGFFVAQVPKATSETITKVLVNYGAIFVLSDAGNVYSCGANSSYGGLGVGDLIDRSVFTKITALSSVVDLSIGLSGSDPDYWHALAVTSSGALYAWGLNISGQLGDGTATSRSTPTLITGGDITGKTITKCYAFGGYYGSSFVLDSNNNIYSCGGNAYGQLGLGDTTDRNVFRQITTLKASAIYGAGATSSTYYTASIFIVWQGNVWATGYNGRGGLGVGDTVSKSSFTSISGLSNVVSLAISNNYPNAGISVAALLTDGTIRTWGRNDVGQLGTGVLTDALTPQTLAGVSGLVFSKIQFCGDASAANFFALSTNANLYVCGYQGRAFGDGGSISVNKSTLLPCRKPVNVSFNDFRVYGASTQLTIYAKSTTGELWSWGYNNYYSSSVSTAAGGLTMPQKAFLN